MSDCIFCQIIEGTLPITLIYEDEHVIVFKDIKPKAPVHLLLVSKEHIESLAHISEDQAALIAHMMLLLPKLAKAQGLSGFRTQINTGQAGGQEVPHLHIHLLGG
ncbi:MAG: histidine triad nucleotide-binding protein [Gammaproteobacteria bacterium]|nr:histidine triad nucleotide-binding protein [Gammaproteobacteria bacterium]MBP9729393.1 histidine triad nucleotide-binding protein [Gammaproteobacteria bacterium]